MNGSEPAFSQMSVDSWGKPIVSGGLTKREAVAAMAMQGLMTVDAYWIPSYVATRSVEFADALLAELSKGGDE